MKTEACYYHTTNTRGRSDDDLGVYLHNCMHLKKPYVVIRSGTEQSHIEYITSHLVILDYRFALLKAIQSIDADLVVRVRESFAPVDTLGGLPIAYISHIPNDLATVVAKKMCQVFADSLRLRG